MCSISTIAPTAAFLRLCCILGYLSKQVLESMILFNQSFPFAGRRISEQGSHGSWPGVWRGDEDQETSGQRARPGDQDVKTNPVKSRVYQFICANKCYCLNDSLNFITLRDVDRNQPHLMIPVRGRKLIRSSRGRGRSSCCPCRGNLQRCRRSPSYRTRRTRLVCRRRPRSSSRECCSWRQDKHSLQPRRSEPPHHWGWRFRQQRGRRTWKPWLDSRAQHNSGGPVLIARVLYQKIWDQICYFEGINFHSI